MKAILWQGQRIETDDRVADAVLELARLLLLFRRTERIEFPAHVDGREVTAWLVLGDGEGVGAIQVPGSRSVRLTDADRAVERLRARIAGLDEPQRIGEFELPDDFSVLDHDITS